MKSLPLIVAASLLWMSSSEQKCLTSKRANALMSSWLHVSAPSPDKLFDYANRSVSPWNYSIDHDDNIFPSKIRHAVCKSKSCIINGQVDHGYNSVPVYQAQMVLLKKPCKSKLGHYYFEVGFKDVPVACTCVVPRY